MTQVFTLSSICTHDVSIRAVKTQKAQTDLSVRWYTEYFVGLTMPWLNGSYGYKLFFRYGNNEISTILYILNMVQYK